MVRELIEHRDGRVYINEDLLDLYSYPSDEIGDWKPETVLPPFDTSSKLYLDIETYSNNGMVLDSFIKKLNYGRFDKSDKPMGDHVVNMLVESDMPDEAGYLQNRLEGDTSGKTITPPAFYEMLLISVSDFLKFHYDQISQHPRDIDPRGALQADKGRIVLIGLMNERGDIRIIDCEQVGEAAGIKEFFNILEKKKPQFLAHFNGFDFDLPFIVGRCAALGLSHPFWVSDRPTVFRTATLFNKPVEYNAFWVNKGATAIIDLYHQSLAWDFVYRKLTRFSLKEVPIQLGLRQERRLTLSYAEMKACVEAGDMDTLKAYLQYDLEDSKLLGDFLLPDIYYQKQVLPHWNYQSLSTGGMGSKWNDILLTEYKKIDGRFVAPCVNPTEKYEGGLVGGRAGLYRWVAKIDVASLYPSIMLAYHVCSEKDRSHLILAIIKYLKVERLRLKKIAKVKKGTPEGRLASQMQGALKVMLNCFTGDTLVTTSKGVFTMAELAGTSAEVITSSGNWVTVPFHKYHQDVIWNVTVKRGKKDKTFRCTGNHRWLAAPYSRRTFGRSKVLRDVIPYDVLTTSELKLGMILPHVRTPKPKENQDYFDGVVHGIVYGDGTHHKTARTINPRFSVALANCKNELEKYFHLAQNIRYISTHAIARDDMWARVSLESATNLKQLPQDVSHSYILGFIRGLIATDGNVAKRDGLTLISGRKETCEWVEKWGCLVGFDFETMAKISDADVLHQYPTGKYTTNYDIYNLKFGIGSLSGADFLRDFHRENYQNVCESRAHKVGDTWRVISVEQTDVIEDIYCCVESETETFMLHGGVLTKQSSYGSFGTTGKEFNDYEAAAIVTAYGRAILKKMIDSAVKCGCIPVSWDTDGLYYAVDDSSFAKHKTALEVIQASMPKGIELEYELEALAFYVPPATSKDAADDGEGMRKNYIIITKDDRTGAIKIKANGKFRKRDKSELERSFVPGLVKAYLDNESDKYYENILVKLMCRDYPVENLAITRKIKITERRLVDLGIGNHNEVVTIYKAPDKATYGKRGQVLKTVEAMWTNNPSEIDWNYYINMVKDMYNEFQSIKKF